MESSQRLCALIKSITCSLLSNQEIGQGVEIVESDTSRAVKSHWMSIIMVWGDDVKIVIKNHFTTDSGKFLASTLYRRAPEDVSLSQALDYYREFGNLTAGVVKRVLNDYDLSVGISLPVVTRGFDEVFARKIAPPGAQNCSWDLRGNDFRFSCSSEVYLKDMIELKSLDEKAINENYIKGDIEFF